MRLRFTALLAVLLVPALGWAAAPAKPLAKAPVALKTLFPQGKLIGAAVGNDAIITPSNAHYDAAYNRTLLQNFNTIVAENAFKGWIWKGRACGERGCHNVIDFSHADRIAAFARANHLRLRGHVLVYYHVVPAWLSQQTKYDAKQRTWVYAPTHEPIRVLLRDYVRDVMTHFKGQVFEWDVVNEAVSDKAPFGPWPAWNPETCSATQHCDFWETTIGPSYPERAFVWANAVDQQTGAGAQLFYNDYNNDAYNGIDDPGFSHPLTKAEAVSDLAYKIQHTPGAHIDGVGLQAHLKAGTIWGKRQRNLARRYQKLGLDLMVTELDARIPLYGKRPTRRQLRQQARTYASVTRFVLGTPNVQGMLLWGFTDRYSWIPRWQHGWGAGLPFNAQEQPKPALFAMEKALRAH